jgi:hypothetical protein
MMVQKYLDRYIEELEGLFERHRAGAGCPELELEVH